MYRWFFIFCVPCTMNTQKIQSFQLTCTFFLILQVSWKLYIVNISMLFHTIETLLWKFERQFLISESTCMSRFLTETTYSFGLYPLYAWITYTFRISSVNTIPYSLYNSEWAEEFFLNHQQQTLPFLRLALNISTLIGAFANLLKVTASLVKCPYICLSVCMERVGSHLKHFRNIWYLRLFQNSVQKIQVWLKPYNKTSTLHKDPCAFMISRWIMHRMRNISEKTCRENAHFMFCNNFSENRAV